MARTRPSIISGHGKNRSDGVLEDWSEYWGAGLLEYWSVGVLGKRRLWELDTSTVE
jgi:hypothetical protein